MAKVEVTKAHTVCDRCGAKVSASGRIVQFVEDCGLRTYAPSVEGLSFCADLCRTCAESLVRWWEKKAGEVESEAAQ